MTTNITTNANNIRNNSNALLALDARNTIAHTTLTDNVRVNSNALVYLNTQNTSAHGTMTTNITTNANNIRNNSNALLALDARNTIAHNTMANNIRANSNLVLEIYDELMTLETGADGHIVNSALNDLYGRVKANSNAINYYAPIIRNNSYILAANGGIIAEHYVVSEATETISNLRFIKNGFTIPNGKTLILNDPLRVSGNLSLGDGLGVLQLGGDLTLGSDSYLTSAGKINGGGYTLKLTNSFVVPNSGHPLKFTGNAVVDGGGQVVSFDPGAYLLVDSGMSVTLRNMILRLPVLSRSNNQETLTLAGNTSCLTLQNVTVSLEANYVFSTGHLFVDNDVIMSGNHSFSYSSDKAMTIQQDSMLYFDTGSKFAYAPSVANRDLVRMTDATSKLFLNGATLSSTSTGLRLTKGTLVIDNKNEVRADGSTLSNAIAFGNGIDDLTINVMPGGSIDVKTGCLDYAMGNLG